MELDPLIILRKDVVLFHVELMLILGNPMRD
jgi:hypothetical protein